MDLICHEYSWKTDDVLELSLRRFRQILATISERRTLETLGHTKEMLGYLRTVCSFIAATVPIEKEGQKSPLLDSAKSIGAEILGDAEPESTTKSAVDAKPGSYEKFMEIFSMR